MSKPENSVRVGLIGYRIVGVVGAVSFLGASAYAAMTCQSGPAWVCGLFAAVGLYLILGAGTYELTEEAVSHRCLSVVYRMPWRDVRRIEGGNGGTLVLCGVGKRLIVAPPAWWSGRQKREAFALLCRKIEELGLKVQPNRFADGKIHWNVRIRE